MSGDSLAVSLPALPIPDYLWPTGKVDVPMWSANKMRDYAIAALEARPGCVDREVAAAGVVALMPFLRDDALLCDVREVVTSMLASAPKASDMIEGATAVLRNILRDREAAPFSFDALVAHGLANGANIVNGMPWSFKYMGLHVTHETDDHYLVCMPDGSALDVKRAAAPKASDAKAGLAKIASDLAARQTRLPLDMDRAMSEHLGDFLDTPQPDPAPPMAGADTAWESTTEGYARFVSHDRYLKFSQDARRWYKPYRCSQCEGAS